MKINEVRKMAKKLGINSFGLKKIDLIRKIQEKEGNIPCFGTPRVNECNEFNCLWREDCLKISNK